MVIKGLGLGLGQGPGNALAVLFFSSGLISVVNTFVFVGSVVSVSTRRVTYGIRSCDPLLSYFNVVVTRVVTPSEKMTAAWGRGIVCPRAITCMCSLAEPDQTPGWWVWLRETRQASTLRGFMTTLTHSLASLQRSEPSDKQTLQHACSSYHKWCL